MMGGGEGLGACPHTHRERHKHPDTKREAHTHALGLAKVDFQKTYEGVPYFG